ncbi:FkbM family methyltransferase [Paragemmobacter straminiformis]|uniref:FkbM family methyltransferase n=1 Tax=Paragemmobacter straminiformis TaxID=2045119 RepID=A0A842IEC3_9RHOB|nr:FkbM family methyltransferase [Gemmobacter straminiformis]MBC2837314.1 FkbM family methyltransferase [Gemmobacter straminiformis]
MALDPAPSRKLKAIVSCQRNEALWICEWVAYHRSIGFDRIFVVSNDCTDGSELLLDRLAEMGEVIHLRQSPPEGVAPQPAGCALALAHPDMRDVEWVLHIDTDEFLNVTCGAGQVADLLGKVGEADCIAVSWRMFGSEGRRLWPGGTVLETCTMSENWLRRSRALQKCFFRPDAFAAVDCHMPKDPRRTDVVLKNTAGRVLPNDALHDPEAGRHTAATIDMVTWENACINHYAIRSEDVFVLKNLRGDGMAMKHAKYLRGSTFWNYADRNQTVEPSILKHMAGVRDLLALYRSDPEILRLEAAAWSAFQALRDEVLVKEGRFGWNAPPPPPTDGPETAAPRPRDRKMPDTASATRLLIEGLALARPTVVLDVGANPINDVPYKDLLKLGGCDVIGFEPQPEAFAKLQSIKSEREVYHPFAVGDGSEKELKIYYSDGMTSLFEPYTPAMQRLGRPRLGRVLSRVPMKTVALDEVEAIDAFDLLKIDIQGGEVDVFRGAAEKLKATVAVIVELRHFRLYEDEPMSAGVDEALRGSGFALHKYLFNKAMPLQNSQLHRLNFGSCRDQLIDGDAVYIRDLTRIDEIATEGLKHLAILASAVFDSQTVALICLDELVQRGALHASLPKRYVDRLPARYKRPEDAPAPPKRKRRKPAAEESPA